MTKPFRWSPELIARVWTPEKRERLADLSEKRNALLREDPDEDTIYNVLCPKIREGWSEEIEQSRCAPAYKVIPFEVPGSKFATEDNPL